LNFLANTKQNSKNALARESGAKGGLFAEKNEGRKSCVSEPLIFFRQSKEGHCLLNELGLALEFCGDFQD
jgi:hypothetical protein